VLLGGSSWHYDFFDAATFAASYQSTDNAGGSASAKDADSFTITLKHSF
jgi:hypothetical protein